MATKGLTAQELSRIGVPKGEATRLAGLGIRAALEAGAELEEIRGHLRAIVRDPAAVRPHFADFAAAVARERSRFVPRDSPAVFRQWGQDLEPQSIEQMQNACRLPIAVRGALMPDAHVGYGLPIGGVLATRGAVVPYAVGVDIACRMKLSVLDLPVRALETDGERLRKVLEEETRFGLGASFARPRRTHAVLDENWSASPVTQRLKDKAWAQLGGAMGVRA